MVSPRQVATWIDEPEEPGLPRILDFIDAQGNTWGYTAADGHARGLTLVDPKPMAVPASTGGGTSCPDGTSDAAAPRSDSP